MNKSICFVDDDRDELRRFRECLGNRYIVGAGATLEEALGDLRKRRVRKPDVFVLDLYYGPQMNEEVRRAIEVADETIFPLEAEIRSLLAKAGQSPDHGFELAEEAHRKYSNTPRVFFSRKAFLEDALRAHEKGLPLLEKPDPDDADKRLPDPYGAAFQRYEEHLARALDRIINLNTWWARNRDWIGGFSIGSFFFLLKIDWDLWRGHYASAAIVFLIGPLAALVVAWVARRG